MAKKGDSSEPPLCMGLLLFRAKRGLYSGSIEVCMASLRVSTTSFLVGTRTLALSPGASVSDIRGLHIYSLAGFDSPWQCSRDLKMSLFFASYHQRGSLESMSHILQHRLIFSETHTGYIYSHGLYSTPLSRWA